MKGRWRSIAAGLLLLLTLLLASGRAGAVVLAEGKGWDRPVELSDSVEVFVDPSGRLGIDEVRMPSLDASFVRGVQSSLPMYTNGTIWVRFALAREAETADDWVVQLHPSWLDEVKVYASDDHEARLITVLGDQHPFNQRALKTIVLAFPVSVGTAPQTYYLQIRTHAPIPLLLNAWRQSGLAHKEAQRAASGLMLAGGVAALVLMLLIFWVRIRDGTYLVFAHFVGWATVVTLVQNGYASSVLFPDNALWGDRFVDVAACFFIASSAVFVSRIFDFRSHSVTAARMANAVAIFFALLIPLTAAGLLESLWWWVLTLIVGLIILNNILLVRIVLRRGMSENPTIALAFLLVTTLWLIRLCIQQGLLPLDHSILERPLNHYFQAANIVLLSFVVTDRLFGIELQRRAQSRRAFESMQRASKALEERSRQREFVAVISHELRTPLAIIGAVSHALEVSPAAQDDRVRRGVKNIRQAIQGLTGLIENLLVDDALESGRRLSEDEVFDLRDVMGRIKGQCLPEDRLRLRIDIPDVVLPLRGNMARIEVLLSNVVQNALKYSEAEARLTGRVESGGLILEIASLGDPIPPSEQARLFDRYFRGARSSAIPGAGLGLHIARSIARQRGGDVELMSSDARGTVFRIRLPLGVDAHIAPEPI